MQELKDLPCYLFLNLTDRCDTGLKNSKVTSICLKCLHLDSTDACPRLMNSLGIMQTSNSIVLRFCPPSHILIPGFSYSQIGHIYPWTTENGTPVIPGRTVTLEGFWHSSTHQVLLLLLYLEPNPKLVFQTAFRFLFLFLSKLHPVGSNTLFCPPGKYSLF